MFSKTMGALAVQFLDQGLHRVIFDAMPMPVFVVDKDVSILEYNSAAAALLGGAKGDVLDRLGGEVLNCVHSREHSKGCGHSKSCRDCVVRNSVISASRGQPVTRRPAFLELEKDGKRKEVQVKVSSRPFAYEEHPWVLLILEGLEDLASQPRSVRPARKASPQGRST